MHDGSELTRQTCDWRTYKALCVQLLVRKPSQKEHGLLVAAFNAGKTVAEAFKLVDTERRKGAYYEAP